MRKFRHTADLHHLWGGQGRARYIEVVKNLGFNDICECEDFRNKPHRYRKESGTVGQMECAECHYLVWPLSSVYECDECMELTLSDKYPVRADEVFLCGDCI